MQCFEHKTRFLPKTDCKNFLFVVNKSWNLVCDWQSWYLCWLVCSSCCQKSLSDSPDNICYNLSGVYQLINRFIIFEDVSSRFLRVGQGFRRYQFVLMDHCLLFSVVWSTRITKVQSSKLLTMSNRSVIHCSSLVSGIDSLLKFLVRNPYRIWNGCSC